MKNNWNLILEKQSYNNRILKVNHSEYLYKTINEKMVFTTLEMSNWVLIVPILKTGELVLVKQFRAGTKSDTLEFPGGSIDPGEDPALAASRELEEETGLISTNITKLCIMDPNPAFMTNKCYVFIAEDCEFTGIQKLDKFEDTEPLVLSLDKVKSLIQTGELTQSLSIAALGLYLNR